MDITQAIAALARRAGQMVTATCSPGGGWIVTGPVRGTVATGSGIYAADAMDRCRVAVMRARGSVLYPKGKEG